MLLPSKRSLTRVLLLSSLGALQARAKEDSDDSAATEDAAKTAAEQEDDDEPAGTTSPDDDEAALDDDSDLDADVDPEKLESSKSNMEAGNPNPPPNPQMMPNGKPLPPLPHYVDLGAKPIFADTTDTASEMQDKSMLCMYLARMTLQMGGPEMQTKLTKLLDVFTIDQQKIEPRFVQDSLIVGQWSKCLVEMDNGDVEEFVEGGLVNPENPGLMPYIQEWLQKNVPEDLTDIVIMPFGPLPKISMQDFNLVQKTVHDEQQLLQAKSTQSEAKAKAKERKRARAKKRMEQNNWMYGLGTYGGVIYLFCIIAILFLLMGGAVLFLGEKQKENQANKSKAKISLKNLNNPMGLCCAKTSSSQSCHANLHA
ncbi:unnamed protein product [Amoebophrya sp. A120]|nr:unnamed protein product [Amoebophrya sp. A120]|eukprot:GSA120T00014819001.1